MDLKKCTVEILAKKLSSYLTLKQLENLIEKPKTPDYGDFALPCFSLSKTLKKSPDLIAKELSTYLNCSFFEDVMPVGPYINVFLNKSIVSDAILKEIIESGSHYGDLQLGYGQNITIDWSSPNIAKPSSMGHLRSTVIGNSIALIAKKCGYTPLKINHLGDWGTQFGKVIAAYKGWGSEEKVKQDPIAELLKLYVEFHDKADKNPELVQKGRYWFKKLEEGDKEATYLWKWFSFESAKAFDKVYQLLGMKSEYTIGESFYNNKMPEILEMLERQDLLELDKGAKIIRLEKEELPNCLIIKSDGASLYMTRDLATALYRKRTFDFEKSVYVVGNEQSLHFSQLKAILKRLGFNWANDIIHTGFGLVKQGGSKLSTRKGNIILLEDVIKESIKMATQLIDEKNPNLQNKEEISRQVGVAAVIFHDLRNERKNEINFNLGNMLKFEGETGPYLQYTNARINSILRKAETDNTLYKEIVLNDNWSFDVVKLLAKFPKVVERAFEKFEPSIISKFLLELAQSFNRYYGQVRILEKNEQLQSRISLLAATAIVLTEGLRLLGIDAPKEM